MSPSVVAPLAVSLLIRAAIPLAVLEGSDASAVVVADASSEEESLDPIELRSEERPPAGARFS